MQANKQLKIIGMLGQKGGPGKTTIGVHIAVAAQEDGEVVGIADTDPQASAYTWVELRGDKLPPVACVEPNDIDSVIEAARKSGATFLLIDTAPHATTGAYHAVARADLILIPCRPTMFDLASIPKAVSIAEATKGKVAFILNQCPASGEEVSAAREALESYGIPVAPVTLGLRKPFARATNTGQAVTEFDPGGKAAAEIRELWDWVKNMIAC